jgi:succinate dehydrogenase/fumarate reductase cytochrome b subunit
MRDARRPYLPAVEAPVDALYWATAILSGIILGLDLLSWPASFFVLAGIGIVATIIGWRVEGGITNHRPTSWLWALIFLAVWLIIALVWHTFPFDR